MFRKRLVHILIEAVFPSKCLICESFIEQKENYRHSPSKQDRYFPATSINDLTSDLSFHGLLADMVCPACLSLFLPVHSPLCPDCGVVFQSNAIDDHQCEACIKAPKRFQKARAFGIYDQSLMELIHCFKYRGKIQLARAFGAMLLLTFLC